MNHAARQRILAVALSTRGFGYAVLEGETDLIAYGVKAVAGDKNAGSLAKVEKLLARYQPDLLVLSDVNAKGVHRSPRIKALHRQVSALAGRRNLAMKMMAGKELRQRLLGRTEGTRHELAVALAGRFSDELADRLPPKRKPWKSEDARLDIFEAVGLAVSFSLKQNAI